MNNLETDQMIEKKERSLIYFCDGEFKIMEFPETLREPPTYHFLYEKKETV